MSGKWIKDGFITYGYKDWHYFPSKGKISACAAVLAHQRGWLNGTDELPDTASKINTCLACKKVSDKIEKRSPKLDVSSKKEPCGKIEYFSEAEAGKALLHIRTSHKDGRHEKRAYYCTDCTSWHLTSH